LDLKRLVTRGLSRRRVVGSSKTRKARVRGEEAGEAFVLIVCLMVLFFLGLVGLEVVHMVWMGSWNDVIFNGIMLVVGTIVGAIWGRNAD